MNEKQRAKENRWPNQNAVAEQMLAESLPSGTQVRELEANIFTAGVNTPEASTYDTGFGNIYEWVACNPIYNRLVWGYSIKSYSRLAAEALSAVGPGVVLDLACGSLAFTSHTYVQFPPRVIICTDQSIKMLRLAKARLVRLHGKVPDHIVFLLADALHLPFVSNRFGTILCLNLLHCIPDVALLLRGLRQFVLPGSTLYFTTLVEGNRPADRYLHALARAGKLIPRGVPEVARAFREAGLDAHQNLCGNLAFIRASADQAR